MISTIEHRRFVVRVPVRVVSRGFVPRGFAAWVPLPGLIVFSAPERITLRRVAHELAHVRQWAYEGWWFPVKYALAWARAGFVYRDNAYEVEARLAEVSDAQVEWATAVMAGLP